MTLRDLQCTHGAGNRQFDRMFEKLAISSPKQNKRSAVGWSSHFPYYAGFSENFTHNILESTRLNSSSIILDPWNGSGTTTYISSMLGLSSLGFDLNPVMVIIARARLVPPTEADTVEPLANEIVKAACARPSSLENDPLALWFSVTTAKAIRGLERSIRRYLVGKMTSTPTGINFDQISGLAAIFYAALFSVCRELAAPFRSSNPTWYRLPKREELKVHCSGKSVSKMLLAKLGNMASALAARRDLIRREWAPSDIRTADTAEMVRNYSPRAHGGMRIGRPARASRRAWRADRPCSWPVAMTDTASA